MLKGIAVSSIIKLVLAVLLASAFITIITVGPLGDALQHTFENIGDITDSTVEVSNTEQMSDLAMFVVDRSVNQGCEEVNARNEGERAGWEPNSRDGVNGYPGLSESYLTQYPECFGAEAGILNSPSSLIPDVGPVSAGPDENFMPGAFSRERFEVTEDFKIYINSGESWIENENAVLGPSLIPVDQKGEDWQQQEAEGLNPQIPLALTGASVGIMVGGRLGPAGAVAGGAGGFAIGTISEYGGIGQTNIMPAVIYLNQDVNGLEELDDDLKARIDDSIIEDQKESDVLNLPDTYRFNFCEGDTGYIQGSRGHPGNDAHTSEEPLHVDIVIEESGCEVGNGNEE